VLLVLQLVQVVVVLDELPPPGPASRGADMAAVGMKAPAEAAVVIASEARRLRRTLFAYCELSSRCM
jgi:hypothetical protein